MNLGRWRTALVYVILFVILFSASAIIFGTIEDLQTGTEVSYQNSQVIKPKTEAERIKSELALVGIKTAEDSAKRNLSSDQKTNKGTVQNLSQVKAELRTINDFPSPVKATPIKEPGNYYSESFQAYLFHPGTDYPQSEGAVIRIKHTGKVVYAGPDPILGQKVEIDCGDDWSVIYGGLANLRVKEGDQVQVNQAIGQIGYYPGADGVKDEPQLHYEVWHGDEVQVPNIEAS